MIPRIFLSALCALTTCTASPLLKRLTYPDPEPCTGNCSWIHDPNIIKKDSTYYRFSTSGNIAIATAPSLTGPWEYQGPMLTAGTSINVGATQDIWAPDVNLIDGTYYAYYCVSLFGTQTSDIGLATSRTLDSGSWTDHGSLGLPPSSAYNLIDPNLYIPDDVDDPDAAPYLTFGSYWDGIFQTRLGNLTAFSDRHGSIGSAPLTNIVRNATASPQVLEGGIQYRHTLASGEQFFYLFFSAGACCNTPPKLAPAGAEYRIMVCRAESIVGPYVDSQGRDCAAANGGTEVLGSHGDVYAPGGQGVIEDGGRTVLVYHYGELCPVLWCVWRVANFYSES
jgi:arabinan endo-1,5-alpha-L-arabinosidase